MSEYIYIMIVDLHKTSETQLNCLALSSDVESGFDGVYFSAMNEYQISMG